jgi:hypothetical protein
VKDGWRTSSADVMVVSGSPIDASAAQDPCAGAAATVVAGRPSAQAIKKAIAEADTKRRFILASTVRLKPDTTTVYSPSRVGMSATT